MKKRVALFFGSFNPIHIGHLALANHIAEYGGVDEVRFVVSPQNPFKQNKSLMDDTLRVEWVRRAIGDYPKFSVTDIELSMPKPSYTSDTLERLSALEPDVEFLLVMGGDNLVAFSGWRRYEWIMANYPILVYPRLDGPTEIPTEWRSRMTLLENAPRVEVSSTFIRNSILDDKDVRFFLPIQIWHDVSKEVKEKLR
ncbi:MAG: nicotinate-nucleotide adenylyltransferase [Paludibacteraceae bacterium]|nr:nicotinate-nucleotide adenylyltransferase [Paludibacteraceae bacterium]